MGPVFSSLHMGCPANNFWSMIFLPRSLLPLLNTCNFLRPTWTKSAFGLENLDKYGFAIDKCPTLMKHWKSFSQNQTEDARGAVDTQTRMCGGCFIFLILRQFCEYYIVFGGETNFPLVEPRRHI